MGGSEDVENGVMECGGSEDAENGCDVQELEAMGVAGEGVVERKKGCGGGK